MSGENYKTKAAGDMAAGQTLERDPRAQNAQKHGILSEYVSEGEASEYAQHLAQIETSTGAGTYLEKRLAGRAALALWRLDRVARYEAAQVSTAQRAVRQAIEAGEVLGWAAGVAAAYERLGRAIGLPASLARLPDFVEKAASERETRAAVLTRWANGGSAEGVSELDALKIGEMLGERLTDMSDPPARAGDVVKAMTGRPARRGEAASFEGGEWIFEPHEMGGLLAFARDFWGEADAAAVLADLAACELGHAAKIRAAQRDALSAEADALALAALPSEKTAEKVTRYEAHLERVLYRALHDLEASRREREGKASAPPLRGVLDENPRE